MAEMTAEEWNLANPVGTPVLAWPGMRELPPLVTRTRSEAWTLGHGDPVVLVEGRSGGIALSHVEVRDDLYVCPQCGPDPGGAEQHALDFHSHDLSAELDRLRAERDTARAELEDVKNNRLVSAIFGHHPGAPRPFALYRHADATGVSGTGVVALGSEFPDGMAVLRWLSDWPTSVVFHERGIESVEAVHGHGGKTQVVWLSDEFEPLAEVEQQRDAALADVERLRGDITATVWPARPGSGRAEAGQGRTGRAARLPVSTERSDVRKQQRRR